MLYKNIRKYNEFYSKLEIKVRIPEAAEGILDLDISSAAADMTISFTSSVPAVWRKSIKKLAMRGIFSLPGFFGFFTPKICSL